MDNKSFCNLYIDGKSFDELFDLFNVNIKDDSEYYFVIAFNLLSYHSDKILSIYCNLNINQKIGIINALCFVKIDNFDTENFLLDLLNDNNKYIIFHSIISLKYIDKNHSGLVERFLLSDDEILKSGSIQYLSNKNGLLFKERLKGYLKDPSSLVREVALDELDDLNDIDLINDAMTCLQDESQNVRNLAQYIVDRLSE